MLYAKVYYNLLHPLCLLYPEGTAAVTVTAACTVRGMALQLFVVFFCHCISCPRKVIILVHKPYV